MIINAFMISEYNLVTINELHSLRRVESLFYLNTISFEIKQKTIHGVFYIEMLIVYYWDVCIVHSMFNQALCVYFNILLIDLTEAFISVKALLFYRVLLALNYTHRSIHYRLSVDESLRCLHSVTTGT